MKSCEERAAALLKDLSLDEKMAQVGCIFPFGELYKNMDWICEQTSHGIGQVSTLEMRRIHGTHADITPRELREIFAKPFQAAIVEGGLRGIMPCYLLYRRRAGDRLKAAFTGASPGGAGL